MAGRLAEDTPFDFLVARLQCLHDLERAIAGTNAVGEIAPNLTLFGRRSSLAAGWMENTMENLQEWIRAPQDVKPGALMPGVAVAGGNWPATNLTDEQVEAIAAYLYSLR